MHSLHPDYMHAKHLGIDKVLLGSVLYVLIHFVLLVGDAEAKVRKIWTEITDIYAADNVPSRLGNLRLTMFSVRTPKLKGKANEVKCLVPVLHKIWKRHMNNSLALHKKIELMLRLSHHMDLILDKYPTDFVLPTAASEDLIASSHIFFLLSVR